MTTFPISLPKDPHTAIISGKTGCGKTQFVLDELLNPDVGYYRGIFDRVFILCPTWTRNRTYLDRPWLWHGSHSHRFIFIDPKDKLLDCLRKLTELYADTPTLYVLDDLAASAAVSKKKDIITELSFSGRHAKQSAWILTQKYNSIGKEFRSNTAWACLFHCKDRFSFRDALDENNIIPTRLREELSMSLAASKHAKLLLKTDDPVEYHIC